jgi:hypothetical protein
MLDRFLYFGNGSNMLSLRLRKRTPSALVVGTGFVEGRRLVFGKVSSDGPGKCNIQPSNELADRVYAPLKDRSLAQTLQDRLHQANIPSVLDTDH